MLLSDIARKRPVTRTERIQAIWLKKDGWKGLWAKRIGAANLAKSFVYQRLTIVAYHTPTRLTPSRYARFHTLAVSSGHSMSAVRRAPARPVATSRTFGLVTPLRLSLSRLPLAS